MQYSKIIRMQQNATLKTAPFPTASRTNENTTLTQLAQQLGYTADEFRRVIEKVITNRDQIEEYLNTSPYSEKIY